MRGIYNISIWWPPYLSLGVTEDDSLGDGERVVEIAQGVELPFLPLHSHEKLLDSFKGQLITVGEKKSCNVPRGSEYRQQYR